MKNRVLILILIYSAIGLSQGRIDGFLKGKGNLDFVLGGGYESNPYYFAGKKKVTIPRDIVIGNLYAAYGITSKLDVNISLPFISVNGKEKSIQDLSIFFKHSIGGYNIGRTSAKLLLAGGFSANLLDYQTEGGNAIGQQAKIIDIRPVLHIDFAKGIFTTIQTGYTYKFDPTPSSIPLTLKFGIAKSKFYIDMWYDYQYSIGGLDYQGTPLPSTFKELGVSYHKIGSTFYKPIKDYLGAYVGITYSIIGRNVSQGLGINAGIVLKHSKKEKK